MAVKGPRNRLIYFRVSEDEYRRYAGLCETTGSRSISDLARSAMKMIQSPDSNENSLAQKLTVVEKLIDDLNRNVRELALSLGKPADETRRSDGGQVA